MSGRKPNSNAKLRNLPPEQKTALTDWLVDEGISYAEAKDRLKEEFGISTSTGALSNFWDKECFTLKFRRARTVAEELVGVMRESDDSFDEATLKAIGQRAFNLAVAQDADVDDLAALTKIMGDSARLKLAQKKLELDINKWRSAVKSKVEIGLDALQDEIKGNPEALALFDQMKAIFLNSVEVAEG